MQSHKNAVDVFVTRKWTHSPTYEQCSRTRCGMQALEVLGLRGGLEREIKRTVTRGVHPHGHTEDCRNKRCVQKGGPLRPPLPRRTVKLNEGIFSWWRRERFTKVRKHLARSEATSGEPRNDSGTRVRDKYVNEVANCLTEGETKACSRDSQRLGRTKTEGRQGTRSRGPKFS